MSAHSTIAAMIGARRLVRCVNPELWTWGRRRWERWLDSQRNAPTDLKKFPVLAVVALTCTEDLALHIGLLQLLNIPSLRCTVVLSLPTEEMARLTRARARREQWHGLAHVVSEQECSAIIRRLSAEAVVAVFPIPGLLPSNAGASLAGLAGGSEARMKAISLSDGNGFLGHAADYLAFAAGHDGVPDDQLTASLHQIVFQDPARLMSLREVGAAPWMDRSEVGGWTGSIHWVEGRVDVPPLGEDGELLITSVDGGGVEVIARHRADLCEGGQSLPFRMPAKFLTAEPQEIRLESRQAAKAIGTGLLFHVPPSRLEPWMISAFLNRGGGGNPVVRAFAEAVRCRLAYAEDEPEILRDIPVVWGVLRESDRILAQAKAQSLYFFYIDHAYFNRGHGKAYRITRNRYEAGPIRDCPPDRLSRLRLNIAPWRKSGRNIIVCPPTEYFMYAHGCLDWLETTLKKLRSVTDRPIIIREKPKPGEKIVPLPQALESAHAVVTHSSNVAIEAACLGTPVFVAPASAAAPIGRTDVAEIEEPNYPDREPWLAHLAYNQFSFDEIRDGVAWRTLLDLEEREFV